MSKQMSKQMKIMMSKLSLMALAMCVATTAAHAGNKSYGTATAKLKVNAMQEWKIEKVGDGEMYLNSESKAGNTVTHMTFNVKNGTATASKYYVTGSGTSLGSDGTIYAVNDDDATTKIMLRPRPVGGATNFDWDSTEIKYRNLNEVAAGAEEKFALITDNAALTPGSYTATIELFAPSV